MTTKQLNPNSYPKLFVLVLFCFFFSGISGLIYQLLWQRMIDKVVGSAPFSVATVLAVFMGGLALGSWLAGKRIDRISSRRGLLSLYGKVEMAIALYAVLLPFLIPVIKPVYIFAYNQLFIHFWLYRLFAFLGCALLLVVPTTLMGVTLPVLCRFYVEELGHIGARTGRLYGINTIGGAAGALLCGFFLIARFGIWGSLLAAVSINVLIGGLCVWLAGSNKFILSDSTAEDKVQGKAKKDEPPPPAIDSAHSQTIIHFALWIFGISGFCSMAYEVFWTRLLGIIIGPTTYSFGLVVATFIIGLALGNILFGWLADRIKGIFTLLVVTQAGAACLALLASQFLGSSQFFFAKLIYSWQGHFGKMILSQSVIIFVVLIGTTICLGATFPLVSKIYARSLPEIGKSIGAAYAMNTLGAILGSFAAGFILIPLLGKENGLRMTAMIQMMVPLLAFICLIHGRRGKLRAAAAGLVALLLIALLLVNVPSWNHKLLARGWYYRFEELEQDFRKTSWWDAVWKGAGKIAQSVGNQELIFYGDGVGGFTTVEKVVDPIGTDIYILMNSGKADASSHVDKLTQTLVAHIPLLFHPNPQKVMVLGLASGMTAGEALDYPIKQMDALEINNQAVQASQFFNPWNNHCLSDPRSRIIVQDGRNHLELTQEKYDVIISEPSNPWMAGLANLFTQEFFETAKERLNSGGIFVQWIHSYDMDWPAFSMVGRTFAEVFPHGVLMKMMSNDLLLVGFAGEKMLDPQVANRNIQYAKLSRNVVIKDANVFFNLVVTEDLKDFFGAGPVHTDNWPRLEFAAPKNIGKHDTVIDEKIRRGGWLSKTTREMVESNKSIDRELHYLEMMQTDYSPPFKNVDLDKATPEQQEKYKGIVEGYCQDQFITNFNVLPNLQWQKRCAQIQVRKIEDHLASGHPDSATYLALASQQKIMGDIQGEINSLQMAIALDPSSGSPYLALGEALTEQGRFSEAEAQFARALSLDPNQAETYNNLGNLYSAQGRTSEAIEQFSKALTINPSYVQAYNNLGAVYVREGKTSEAIEQFNKALAIAPDHGPAHTNLGYALERAGRLDEALQQFQEALKLWPANPDCHNDLGLALEMMGRTDEAIKEYLEALRIDPQHFNANDNLGAFLLKQGMLEDAARYLHKAEEIDPNDAEVHGSLGTLFMRKGDINSAFKHFSVAIRIDPYSSEAQDNMGTVLARLGKRQEAMACFQRALEIDGSNKEARQHIESLQKGN